MRIQAYFRVVGDEATIRAIHNATNLPHASIMQLKTGWDWAIARTTIDIDNPDDGLRALLQAHRPIFPIIKKHQGETDILLEVVTYYEEGEEPRGLYLSAETVQLLSEMGAALDNDVVIVEKGHGG